MVKKRFSTCSALLSFATLFSVAWTTPAAALDLGNALKLDGVTTNLLGGGGGHGSKGLLGLDLDLLDGGDGESGNLLGLDPGTQPTEGCLVNHLAVVPGLGPICVSDSETPVPVCVGNVSEIAVTACVNPAVILPIYVGPGHGSCPGLSLRVEVDPLAVAAGVYIAVDLTTREPGKPAHTETVGISTDALVADEPIFVEICQEAP